MCLLESWPTALDVLDRELAYRLGCACSRVALLPWMFLLERWPTAFDVLDREVWELRLGVDEALRGHPFDSLLGRGAVQQVNLPTTPKGKEQSPKGRGKRVGERRRAFFFSLEGKAQITMRLESAKRGKRRGTVGAPQRRCRRWS